MWCSTGQSRVVQVKAQQFLSSLSFSISKPKSSMDMPYSCGAPCCPEHLKFDRFPTDHAGRVYSATEVPAFPGSPSAGLATLSLPAAGQFFHTNSSEASEQTGSDRGKAKNHAKQHRPRSQNSEASALTAGPLTRLDWPAPDSST